MSRARTAAVVYLGAVAVMVAAVFVWLDEVVDRRTATDAPRSLR